MRDSQKRAESRIRAGDRRERRIFDAGFSKHAHTNHVKSDGVLVVTINNKPFAAMLDLSDENAQDTLLLASRLRAQIAALSIHNQARKDGIDKTTAKEVNAVIKKKHMEQKQGNQLYWAQVDISLDFDSNNRLTCYD
jgi:hypothetical protein